jgi:CheY-like chemotaxis protein
VKQRPDLILIDLQFPIPDGLEATRRIKANPSKFSRRLAADHQRVPARAQLMTP